MSANAEKDESSSVRIIYVYFYKYDLVHTGAYENIIVNVHHKRIVLTILEGFPCSDSPLEFFFKQATSPKQTVLFFEGLMAHA